MLMGLWISSAIMGNSTATSQKIKNRTTIWFSSPTIGYIFKENEIIVLKRHLYSHVCCNIIHSRKDMEQPNWQWMNGCRKYGCVLTCKYKHTQRVRGLGWHKPPISFHGLAINFSLLQTDVSFCLTSLCIRHKNLHKHREKHYSAIKKKRSYHLWQYRWT